MRRKPDTSGIKVDPNEIDYDSMVFYITWYEQLIECGDEFFLKAVKQLCEYSFHGVVPDNSNDPLMKMFFNMAKGSIDANIKLRIAGKMGAESRWKNKDSEKNQEPEQKKTRTRKKTEEEKPKELTPKELAEAKGYEDVDEDGFYPATPHNVAIDLGTS